MEQVIEIIAENWVELCGAIGTILTIFFCRNKTPESRKAKQEKELAKAKKSAEKAARNYAAKLEKQAALEKEGKENA